MLKGLKVYIQYENQSNSRKRKREQQSEAPQNASSERSTQAPRSKRESWMTAPPTNLFGAAPTSSAAKSSQETSESSKIVLPKYDLEGKLITAESTEQKQLDREFAAEYARMKAVKGDDFAFENEGAMRESEPSTTAKSTTDDAARQERLLREAQINQHRHIENVLSTCLYCRKSKAFKKHLMISLGNYTYLALPPYGCFVEGHCIISTLEHKVAATLMDENELHEINLFKHHLQKMFLKQNKYCIFLETITRMHRSKQLHSYIECIPVPIRVGQQASAYFHQSLSEVGSEFSENKKMIPTQCGKPLRSYIPTNFPYFHVEFGRKNGLVHVIEGDDFSFLFGREVIGGILGMTRDQLKTRAPGTQQEAVLVQHFLDEWSEFDWTTQLDGDEANQ